MKKYFLLTSMLLCYQVVFCQNVGVNTSTPAAALDVNGDIILRSANLVVADGITLALDVNTSRFSYYRIEGPTANFTLAGITAGIDGRLLTLFNRCGFIMQLNNEDPSAAPADMIITGTNGDITIVNKGIVNLQYDATEQKWIVKSSSKGGAAGGGGLWDVVGSDIFNTNTGNVGIGTNNPTAKLTIQTPLNSTGWRHIGGNSEIILDESIGGVSAAIGTSSNHAFRIFTNGVGKFSVYPAGEVVVGSNATGSFGKLTVETLNNSYGISHLGEGGNILATQMGGTSAGIGTFSNTNMRIFSNSYSAIFIAAATGNVGIGTNNPDIYKLAVNGNIRAKEIRVNTGWADYVFMNDYQLMPLGEVEQFIKINNHLPGISPASKLQKEGVDISEMQTMMMAKIEELTLYLIEASKTIEKLKLRIETVEKVKQKIQSFLK